MNAKKAKAARRDAKRLTAHLPEHNWLTPHGTHQLGECQRGAYKALKRGAVHHVAV